MESIVITGIGIVGPHGAGIDPIVEASLSRQSVFTRWPENINPPHAEATISRVDAFPSKKFFTDRQLRMMDRAMALSSTAAGLAIEDAGLAEDDRIRSCTFLATARAELPSCYSFIQPQLGEKDEQLNAADFPKIARNISCGQVAIKFKMQGPSTVLASGSTASLEALTRAASYIRAGRSKVALVGGYESLSKFSLYFLSNLHKEHLLARPPQFFGMHGGYLVPSEGSCMLILESESHARARGARIYCGVDAWTSGRKGQNENMVDVLERTWTETASRAGTSLPSLGLFSVSAGGSNRPHEVAETQALSRLIDKGSATAQVVAARSLVGEGETWASALQVALAAHALYSGRTIASHGIAPDAATALSERVQGGNLSQRHAIVSGIGAGQNYSTVHLSALDA